MGVTVTTSTSISSITGFKIYAVTRLGANGEDSSIWEYAVGGASGSPVGGSIVWDADPETVIESDNVSTTLVVPAGGGISLASWTVTGGATIPVTKNVGSYGAISAVKIRSMVVDSDCMFQWSDISVKFYKGGNLVETIPYGALPVDTTSSGSTAEAIATFTPTNSDNDSVTINGMSFLLYGDTEIDSPDSTSGQIYVFAS